MKVFANELHVNKSRIIRSEKTINFLQCCELIVNGALNIMYPWTLDPGDSMFMFADGDNTIQMMKNNAMTQCFDHYHLIKMGCAVSAASPPPVHSRCPPHCLSSGPQQRILTV